MELLGKALEYPLSSLEGVAFLEIIIICALGAVIWFLFRMARTMKENAKEARASRGRIYDYVRDELKALREEVGEQMDKIGERIDKQYDALRAHEDTCSERHEADAKWKGRVEGKLGLDEN